MSVIVFRGRDPASEARALLNFVLRNGDIVGTDDAGRTALLLVVDPRTLDRLLAFDAGSEELEDTDGEPEPDHEIDGPATVVDFVPPKQLVRMPRVARALAIALLLVTVPLVKGHADQASMVTPLSMSTAQAPAQCCRICRKGQSCGDACISSTKQCKEQPGCACSASGLSSR